MNTKFTAHRKNLLTKLEIKSPSMVTNEAREESLLLASALEVREPPGHLLKYQ